MRLHQHGGWKRTGVSLLWDAEALREVLPPEKVMSLREMFAVSGSWPTDLPGSEGNALVVAGLEGILDVLSPEDAVASLEADLKDAILGFQGEFEGSAALIFWLPSGKKRVRMNQATEEYFWRSSSSDGDRDIPLGRCLWSGAQSDVERILVSTSSKPDPDGDGFVGLYHPRIS